MRRALAVLALALSGCQLVAVREPVPEGFQTAACQAFGAVINDYAFTLQLGFSAGFYEDDAERWLDAVVPWDPGTAFVVSLRQSIDYLRLGYPSAGIVTFPDREYRELADKTGFHCNQLPSIPRPSPSPSCPTSSHPSPQGPIQSPSSSASSSSIARCLGPLDRLRDAARGHEPDQASAPPR